MATGLTKATVEEAGLGRFSNLGYEVRLGSEIAPDGPVAERDFGIEG